MNRVRPNEQLETHVPVFVVTWLYTRLPRLRPRSRTGLRTGAADGEGKRSVRRQGQEWQACCSPGCVATQPPPCSRPVITALLPSQTCMPWPARLPSGAALWRLTTVKGTRTLRVSLSVSAQDGIVALGKAHTRSTPSLCSLHKVAFETVPIFVWMNTDCSRPWRVECRPIPFSTPLFFRRSMLWYFGLSMFTKFLKPRSIPALPSCRPDVIFAVLASLSARSFPLTPACPGQ